MPEAGGGSAKCCHLPLQYQCQRMSFVVRLGSARRILFVRATTMPSKVKCQPILPSRRIPRPNPRVCSVEARAGNRAARRAKHHREWMLHGRWCRNIHIGDKSTVFIRRVAVDATGGGLRPTIGMDCALIRIQINPSTSLGCISRVENLPVICSARRVTYGGKR